LDVANLVLSYVQVLAWPAAVVVGVAVFRHPISQLLGRISHAKLPGGTELDFDIARLAGMTVAPVGGVLRGA
jgi:hypothetical protein